MRVSDSSWYNKKIDVECGTLEVTPPGYTDPVIFNVDEGFSTVLNSSNLKVKKAKVYADLQPLADGVYKIRYSIKPNDSLWVEYEHLRIDNVLKTYFEARCALRLQACEPDSITTDRLSKLKKIKQYIDFAKSEVEVGHNRARGLELYDFANKLLTKYKNKDCLNC